ncbi:MAG TPA: DUF2726 domain-containing protein [Arenicellales bacterium]|nr:DUF2726 domain-containing protein [Arenicellales bacterium]
MDYFALLLPVLLIIGLFAGLVILKRRLFSDEPDPAPIPMPELNPAGATGADSAKRHLDPPRRQSPSPATPATPNEPVPAPVPVPRTGGAEAAESGVSLTPARLYPRRLLESGHKRIYSILLKALPGYVILPRITYDQFLEARDGTPSENTSLQNRAAQQLADFVVCDRKLNVLLVCQVEDGRLLPARIQEREKMLHKAGLRLLRWKVDAPPDASSLLNTIRTLEKLRSAENA